MERNYFLRGFCRGLELLYFPLSKLYIYITPLYTPLSPLPPSFLPHLAVLSAMKMETVVTASRPGKVKSISVTVGETLEAGDLVAVIE